MKEPNEFIVNVGKLARLLQLPAAWIKEEALAGRLPCLKIGRRLMFNAEAVRRALLDRAAKTTEVAR